MSTIPTAETITPEWLTQQLRRHGHGGDIEVHDFEAERIGTGQVGKCIRYTLDIEGGKPSAPSSLIGKFASDDPASRATGVALNSFIKEVSFYKTLQNRLRIQTPDCYYAAIDGNGPDFMLLLEDLAPAVQGDQLAGCDAVVADAAIQQLVGLHAPSWRDPELCQHEWLGALTAETAVVTRELYASQLPAFFERFRDHLEPDEADIIAGMAEADNVWRIQDGPKTLIHIDYRLDNLLINEDCSPPFVCAVDWQSVTVGNPLTDVAYFLGAGMQPADRLIHERAIVEDYWVAMRDAGIPPQYSFDECWEDYRRATLAGFLVTIVAAPMVVQTERGDEMFTAMAKRHARHALDLDAAAFF